MPRAESIVSVYGKLAYYWRGQPLAGPGEIGSIGTALRNVIAVASRGICWDVKVYAMKTGKTRRAFVLAVILGLALSALAFYAVRDFLAAFILFSVAFLALGAVLLLVISAEEALVWAVRRTEFYFGRFRSRRPALAANPAHRRT